MGLDTTIFHTTGKPKDELKEVAYWRKNYTLTNFIIDKFGFAGDNNCRDIPLSPKAIKSVISFLKKRVTEGYEEYHNAQEDIETFKKLYKIIETEGGVLIFHAWW
jgi:hypothetical protein